MENVLTMLRRFVSMVLAFFLALVPFANGNKTKDPGEVRCKVALVSDVHIDRRLPAGQLALRNCYQDMLGLSPDGIAVLIGDASLDLDGTFAGLVPLCVGGRGPSGGIPGKGRLRECRQQRPCENGSHQEPGN